MIIRVPVSRSAGTNLPQQPKITHQTLHIINEQNQRLSLPYAPKTVEHAGLSGTYTEVARSGRVPLVIRTGDALPTMSFEVFIGSKNIQSSVEDTLRKLRSLGNQRQRLTIGGMGPNEEAGPWRMTSLSISSVERQHGTNSITRCTAQLAFTKVSDAAKNVGPVSGGVRRGKPGISSAGSGSSGGGSSIGGDTSVTGGSTSPNTRKVYPYTFTVTSEASVFVLAEKVYGTEDAYKAIKSTSKGANGQFLLITTDPVLKRGQVVMLTDPSRYVQSVRGSGSGQIFV